MSLYNFIESFIEENPDMEKLRKEENYNYNDFINYNNMNV
jgi:hypothetical protein